MNRLTLNWTIYIVVTLIFAVGMTVAINGAREITGQLILKRGASVEISAFRFFPTPLRIEMNIGREELEKHRSELNVSKLPTGCVNNDPMLKYARELHENIRLEIPLILIMGEP